MDSEFSQTDRQAVIKVLNKVDSIRAEIIELASQLVKIQSVNPNYPSSDSAKYLGGEKECNQYLETYFRSIGCRTDLFEKSKDRTNVVGTLKGQGGGSSLILSGHIDTVPFGNIENWYEHDPLSGKVREGRLYGRGSCDMKGGIAAMSKAVEAVETSGLLLKGDVIIESVVGEETMDHMLGTTATVERGYKADAAIITEPSSLHLQPVTTGVILMRVHVEGKATHATARDLMIRPGGRGDEIGVNAIEKGVKVIGILQELEQQWGITKNHPLFNPGHFVIHPGVIDGAPRGHRSVAVVPDYCDIDYAILFSPSENPDQVKKEIEDHLHNASRQDSWLEHHPPLIEWQGVWPAGEISQDHPICKSVAISHKLANDAKVAIDGFPAPVDIPFFDRAGIPSVAFGPGNLEQAHSENEYVEIDALIRATKTISLTLLNWCGFELK